MQHKYCKEFMEWLTDPLTKKVTVSTVNRKLKEWRQVKRINTHVYHQVSPIHDSQRMLFAWCGEDALPHTSFYY